MNLPATAAAWYGAVVSTLGFSLALYVALRDRARVRITVKANMVAFGNAIDPSSPDERYVVVTVANPGRRAVTVGAVWFTASGKDSFMLTEAVRNGPIEITEGKSYAYKVVQSGLPMERLRSVSVQDQVGRVWRRRVPRSVRKPSTAKLAK